MTLQPVPIPLPDLPDPPMPTPTLPPDESPIVPDEYVDPYALILRRQNEMQETLDAILAKFQVIADEVQPLITTVSEHPFMKMLGKGKNEHSSTGPHYHRRPGG